MSKKKYHKKAQRIGKSKQNLIGSRINKYWPIVLAFFTDLFLKAKKVFANIIESSKEVYDAFYEAAVSKDLSKIKEIKEKVLLKKVVVKYSALILLTVLIVSITVKFDFRPVVVVNINGKPVAVVNSKEDFEKELKNVQNKWQNLYKQEIKLTQTPTFKLKILPKRFISTPIQLTNAIEANNNLLMPVCAIQVNGQNRAILKDMASAEQVINNIINTFSSKDTTKRVDFFEKVEIVEAYAMPNMVKSVDECVKYLTKNTDVSREYVVKKGDTLWDIASNNKIAVDKLYQLNPDVSENVQPGQIIRLAAPTGIINVKTIEYLAMQEETPYETKFENEPSKYRGERTVIAKGKNGKKDLKVQAVRQNGVEIGKVVLEEKVLQEPKTEVIAIGSKPNETKTGTGVFRVPAFGSVTSRFGYRWGRFHEGIDIEGDTGSPVYAADGGKVIFAAYEGGYGNLVKIDHGNGYVTYYGHNSKFLVSVGQKVSKGQQIAKVGSTGNSTGPHVHFEVRKSGTPVDPLKFLK